MFDVQDWEDYSQFRQLLKLKGFSTMQACIIAEKVRSKRLRTSRRWEDDPQKLQAHLNHQQGNHNHYQTPRPEDRPLATILDPQNEKLKSIPIYHRYVAWVLSQGSRRAAVRLGVNRMTLWRWLKKNMYLPKYYNPAQYNRVSASRRSRRSSP